MRERQKRARASDVSGAGPAQVVPISERVGSAFHDPPDRLLDPPRAAQESDTASRLAARIDELETENLRLTQRGAADRAASDATWAARLSSELADHEETCARLIAEHQTWYARFTREHEETRAQLLTEYEQARAQLVAEHEKTRANLVSEHEAALAQVRDETAGLREQTVAGAHDSMLLREILASASWRATQPLRSIGRALRRLFGGT
jgi:hypothetical protein